jgi:hypothetical protein
MRGPKPSDLTGERHNRLTVLRRHSSGRHSRWWCRCDCGRELPVIQQKLTANFQKSCGCYRNESTARRFLTHGRSGTHEYAIWSAIKARCSNPLQPSWKYYGGRGISMCDQWVDSFQQFFADMGARPSMRHSIDRLDNNGPYSPENCRWATYAEQRRNRKDIRNVMWNGQTRCLEDWSVHTGIPRTTLFLRLQRGLPLDRVFARHD